MTLDSDTSAQIALHISEASDSKLRDFLGDFIAPDESAVSLDFWTREALISEATTVLESSVEDDINSPTVAIAIAKGLAS